MSSSTVLASAWASGACGAAGSRVSELTLCCGWCRVSHCSPCPLLRLLRGWQLCGQGAG